MKKMFLLLMVLLTLASVAHADLTPPLDEGGEPIVVNALIPYGEGLLMYYHHGETIYLSDTEDNWHAYPVRWENTDARDTALAARIGELERLELDASSVSMDSYAFAAVGSDLLAVGKYTGALYRVTFEGAEAVITYVAMLDVLPEKKAAGHLWVESFFADDTRLYLLATLQDEKGSMTGTLYAFDQDAWVREEITMDIKAPQYASAAYPWQGGTILIVATVNGTWADAGTYVLNPDNGKMQHLKDYFGVYALPGGSIYACDARQGIVVYREITEDLMNSVSMEGVIPFMRMKSYSDDFVFHPDGRLVRIGQTYADAVDPLQALPITQLNVLTGIHSAPRIELNSNIPDIQLNTEERFAMEETEMDIFANAMTTQSSLYDIFILPIMQAESIVGKGYCVPLTGESAQAVVAEMYPHMAQQLTNENGELVMVPVQLQRRQTIAYDVRAAELLGIAAEDMPTTYGELFEFMRNFEDDYGDLALEYDISLFDTSTARNIGTLRQRMVEDAIALSRVDRKALQANAEEIGALLDATLTLSKEVSDVVAPYFSLPMPVSMSNYEVPPYQDEPVFLFTLSTSAIPTARAESGGEYRYLMFTQPFELALTEDLAPVAIYSGYAMVINPYSTKQDAALRYMDYVLNNLKGDVAADMITTAEPVPSSYMDAYQNMTVWLANNQDDPAEAEYCAQLQELMAGIEAFLYEIPQSYLDAYQASAEITQPVWLDVKEAFAPCNAAWEQFLRGSIDGQQLLRRVLEVSRMIELE